MKWRHYEPLLGTILLSALSLAQLTTGVGAVSTESPATTKSSTQPPAVTTSSPTSATTTLTTAATIVAMTTTTAPPTTTTPTSGVGAASTESTATTKATTQPSAVTTASPTQLTTATTKITTPTTVAATTTTAPPTTTTTLQTTTAAPVLGGACSDNDWCNGGIAGEAVCDARKCACAQDYFELTTTECLPVSTLKPNLLIDNADITSFTCSWTFNDAKVDGLPLTYEITARPEGGGAGTNCVHTGPFKTAQCTGLTPGYEYNVTLKVTFDVRFSASSSEVGLTDPAQPGQINATTTNSSAHVTWTPSEGKVDLYTIAINGQPSNTTQNPVYHYHDLQPAVNYTVTIVAHSNERTSTERIDWFRTQPGVPDPPRNPKLLGQSSTSVRLGWDEPDQPRGDIIKYQVCNKYKVYNDLPSFTPGSCKNTTGTIKQLDITDLLPGAFYVFEIYTINELTTSDSSVSFSGVRTDQTEPGIVSQLVVSPGNRSLTAMWERPASPNGDIIAYRLQWHVSSDNSSSCSVWLNSSEAMQLTDVHTNLTCPDYTGHTVGVNQKNVTYVIEKLQDFEMYTVQVTAFTSIGEGRPEVREQKTSIAKPKAVTNVKVKVLNSTSVNVSWTLPGDLPGPVNYTVVVTDGITGGPNPASCSVISGSMTSCEVTGLDEFWPYSFGVEARTQAGPTLSEQTNNLTTLEAAPGEVTSVSYQPIDGQGTDCDATSITLNWVEPQLMDRNSLIQKYKLLQVSTNAVVYSHDVPTPKPYVNMSRSFSEKVTEFKAQNTELYQIYAVSSGGKAGMKKNLSVTTEACAPPGWESGYRDITSPHTGTSRVTITYPVDFFKNDKQGAITDTGVLVARSTEKLASVNDIGRVESWQVAKKDNFNNFVYKVQIQPRGQRRGKRSALDTFEIGANDSCTINTDSVYLCNGPLPDNFPVYIAAYACTSAGCTQSDSFGPFQTVKIEPVDPPSNAWLAAVIVLAFIAITLTVVLALMYFRGVNPKKWFQKKQQPPPNQPGEELPNPIFEIPKVRPLALARYDDQLDDLHRDTNLLFSDQYGDIGKLSEQVTQSSTFDNANLEPNKAKNRWVNILPYDHSRVKLQQLDEDDPSSDYINANYIPGYNNRREYIATQGPLPGTVDDFWRMVWEHNVQIIVMLTQCKEGNRVKCEKYWPDEVQEPKQYGDIVVNPTSVSLLSKYCITIFEVSMNNQKRRILHFHYLHFPDFSANVEFDVFIDFVQTVRSHVPHEMVGPMVIHCSAGVGRTGTFIGVDRLDQFIKSHNFTFDATVDIFGMVMSMRENRVLMVQTESQFIMIHDCLKLLLDTKKESMQQEDLYINEAFDPYPEVLYENVNPRDGDVMTDL